MAATDKQRRREAYLRWLNWTPEDVAARLRRRDLILRWVEEGRALWRVQPDGVSVVGLRENLLDLFDNICRTEDATARMLAGETAVEAVAAAKEAAADRNADGHNSVH